MTSSNYYSKYVSAKFKYLWLKFIKEYNQTQQTGGYKFGTTAGELVSSMAATYAALYICNTQASVDCGSTQGTRAGCVGDNDAIILSIIASLFLSILSTKKDNQNKNFLYELFASFIRKKIANCKISGNVELVTINKVEEIIKYYLKIIKQINENLKKIADITDTTDTILDNIFLNAEYRDSRRATRLQDDKVKKDKLIELSKRTPTPFTNDDLNELMSVNKVYLGIINSFFEVELQNVEKISYSAFLVYLKSNALSPKPPVKTATQTSEEFDTILSNFNTEFDKKYEEIFTNLTTQFRDDTDTVDVSKFIFVGAYKNDDTVLLRLTKTEAQVAGIIDMPTAARQ